MKAKTRSFTKLKDVIHYSKFCPDCGKEKKEMKGQGYSWCNSCNILWIIKFENKIINSRG